jgi:hypothetical protein
MNYNTSGGEAMLTLKLTQLETQLQALIEGSAARLFPGGKVQGNLAQSLVAAMRAGIQIEPDGMALAPNCFMIYAHPAQAKRYRHNQGVLDELADTLYQAGLEAGLRFPGRLTLVVHPDPAMDPGKAHIQAEMVPTQLGDTTHTPTETGNGASESHAEIVPANVFLIVNKTDVFPLTMPVVNIGRSPNNHLVIEDPRVSRNHAQLRLSQGQFVISDLDSTGGTFVNRRRIRQQVLKPGDVISLAGVPLVFGQEGGPAGGQTPTDDSQDIQAFEPQ